MKEELPRGEGRILIMDDEEPILSFVGRILEHLGYEAEFARDGSEALESYRKARDGGNPFAAVVLDLTVPGGMGGQEAMEQLRAMDPDVKAIVSSGYSNDPVMAQYKQYGFSGVIAKPYDIHTFSQVLHKAMAQDKV